MRTFGPKWFKEGSLIGEYSDHLGMALTQKKQAVALHAAKVDAELASKAKSEFIANMSRAEDAAQRHHRLFRHAAQKDHNGCRKIP